MAILSDVLDANVTNLIDLRDALSQARQSGFMTGPQCDAVSDLAEPHLPCRVMIHMRTKKGAVYVTIASERSHAFIIDHRANVK